jgi:transcriptional regulator with XRE-family HTH domain
MDYNKTIGANIRFEREKRNLTIDTFAKILGVSATTLGLIERGQRGTSIPNLVRICSFFDITLDDLILKDLSSKNMLIKETDESKDAKNRELLHCYANSLDSEVIEAVLNIIKIENNLLASLKSKENDDLYH